MIRLALSLQQPVSEVLEWDDRTIATGIAWLREQNKQQQKG